MKWRKNHEQALNQTRPHQYKCRSDNVAQLTREPSDMINEDVNPTLLKVGQNGFFSDEDGKMSQKSYLML